MRTNHFISNCPLIYLNLADTTEVTIQAVRPVIKAAQRLFVMNRTPKLRVKVMLVLRVITDFLSMAIVQLKLLKVKSDVGTRKNSLDPHYIITPT